MEFMATFENDMLKTISDPEFFEVSCGPGSELQTCFTMRGIVARAGLNLMGTRADQRDKVGVIEQCHTVHKTEIRRD